MPTRFVPFGLAFVLSMSLLFFAVVPLSAQWQPLPSPPGPGQSPAVPQYPPTTPYPPQAPAYPPQAPPYPPQAPAYPPQAPAYPPPQQPQQPQGTKVQPGQTFGDALGRFRVSLPTGAMPASAMYSFAVPAASAFVNIMSVPQDQMFQMQTSNFQGMLQQMGAKINANDRIQVRGRPAQLIGATMRDQQTGNSMFSMNVFVPGPNVWFQVMGPEQSAQHLGDLLTVLLETAQFQ